MRGSAKYGTGCLRKNQGCIALELRVQLQSGLTNFLETQRGARAVRPLYMDDKQKADAVGIRLLFIQFLVTQ